ncbi:conserved hypothetical protein [Trichinella spiralis]|uniref:hypothetical protein n=1 Tax=Trichinella spiralis TaxID=6334 RepID=UPI0001EFCBA0|nr:conserved hypothetical protein [Trichinella spiralis]XP_003379696.1 conserved hypothetical protein [Trichinella spiralis]
MMHKNCKTASLDLNREMCKINGKTVIATATKADHNKQSGQQIQKWEMPFSRDVETRSWKAVETKQHNIYLNLLTTNLNVQLKIGKIELKNRSKHHHHMTMSFLIKNKLKPPTH